MKLSHRERLLGAAVFMLWSLGVVLLPAVTVAAFNLAPFGAELAAVLMVLYVALQAAIFMFAGYWFAMHVGHVRKKRATLPIFLFGYTSVMLGISLYSWVPLVLDVF